ncbi:MAG: endonuclease III [Oscillospiraceae bacterium]|nr:endonuclease III [Oscillospiraceae bacterium]
MKKIELAAAVVERLAARYPDGLCSLQYEHDYQLLFAVRLSAQCTDARVNTITPILYGRYKSLQALAEADIADIEAIVKPCGFFRTKAKDIVLAAQILIERHNGIVPDNMDDLLALPGVGRKTANLILGDVYGQPAIVADTHCIRISNRLGLCNSKDPAKVEQQLKKIVTPDAQNDLCHRFVLFGREVCVARRAKCDICELSDICIKKGI